MRDGRIWRGSQKSAHRFARFLDTADQPKTSRDDLVGDCIPGHFLQRLSSKFQRLVIIASHHVRWTEASYSICGINGVMWAEADFMAYGASRMRERLLPTV
jgi:hypothetical protein